MALKINIKHTDMVLKDLARARNLIDELEALFHKFKTYGLEVDIDVSEPSSGNDSSELTGFI